MRTIHNLRQPFFILLLLAIVFSGCKQQETLTPEEAKAIAKEAYIYGFPMVVNYKTMNMYVLNENSPEYKGNFNEMQCDARLLGPEDKAIVTPNSDTPYCMLWADMRSEPLVISIPAMEPDRFFHFQLIDLYTHNFAYLGSLTTGNEGGNYLIAPSDWSGETPEGINEVIKCETDMFFSVIRTQLMNNDDLPNVKNLMDGYELQTLSSFLGEDPVAVKSLTDFPTWEEGAQFTPKAFSYLDYMLNFTNPVPEEQALRDKLAKLDLGTEGEFNMDNFEPEVQAAIEKGVSEAFKEMETFITENNTDPLMSSKIFGTRDFLAETATESFGMKNYYMLRATAAHLGLYGNSGKEAIYPTYLMEVPGTPFNAKEHNYTLTFHKDSMPPVNAFWSLSMYDGKTQLFIENDLDRYLLNSNNKDQYVYGDDGSLTLYIQKEPPGKALEPNWLPAPDGPFYCVLRLYGPKEEALNGTWVNPPLKRND
ncbi:DUF1254 domain-containing protein [Robertkochia marina]|uniref:DUF1254 domain-containing protein n=1 Tax=Robertkochia marina TaxID=1227945 RepID=A0A4S3LY12_9FLAO|nr:DUF1254 domain-containing protein [Robertkochia marina]THD66458.1 DUF1254 domain-containing protein [Robertkochia marina]TRZ44135.1 DUF1254 domain-containing protein [Robertkochia marina]